MASKSEEALTSTVVFRLGTLGTLATARMTEALEPHELKPKHVGLLSILDAGTAASQLEIAQLMGIAPSFVVALADHLAQLGAIDRVRDPADRRRQVLTLTDRGRTLFATCTTIANDLDTEFVAELTAQERSGLRSVLRKLAAARGMPALE